MEKEHVEEATQELEVVVEGEEPEVVVEEQPTEEVIQPTEEVKEEPTPEPAPVSNPEIEALKAEINELKYQRELASQLETTPTDPDMPDFGDIYTDPEGYQNRMIKWVQEQKEEAAKEAEEKFVNSERFKALETSHWEDQYQRSVDKAKTAYEDRLDFDAQGKNLIEIQRQHPGTSVADAHKLADYDKLLEDFRRLKEGQRERANTQQPDSGGATRMVQKEDDGMTKISLNAKEKATAMKFFGHLGEKEALQKYARGKDRQQNKNGEI
jgi:hypothetical protein